MGVDTFHELRVAEITMCRYAREALEERNYAQVKYWSEKLLQLQQTKESMKKTKDIQ